jgi:hypothetical protein
VFNRAEIDERKCQQQMKVFDGLDASTPGMMGRVGSASTIKTSDRNAGNA